MRAVHVSTQQDSQQRVKYPTPQFVSSTKLQEYAVYIVWIGLFFMVVGSTVGTAVPMLGGWQNLGNLSIYDYVVYGVIATLIQGLLSFCQWAFKSMALATKKGSWMGLYLLFLMISVLPSFYTYYTGANMYFAMKIAFYMDMWYAQKLTGIFLFLCVLFLDMIPEWTAVKQE